MKIYEFSIKHFSPSLHKGEKIILALGAESAGNFSVFSPLSFRAERSGERNLLELENGTDGVYIMPKGFLSDFKSETRNDKNKKLCGEIYFSDDFGDLLDEKNFKKFQKAVLDFLKKNKIKPDVILTDLHPLYKTTLWGAELAKKFKAKHIKVQHHLAHIFSAIGEDLIFNFQFSILKQFSNPNFQNQTSFFGIALDGTGYGTDGKIWGGEVFQLSINNLPAGRQGYQLTINRIGHLENQTMIGGDLTVKEPARMLIAILAKINPSLSLRAKRSNLGLRVQTAGLPRSSEADSLAMTRDKKDFIYNFVKKYYTRNEFELLYNQLQNNFNCVETSSTGRILDAVSLLLGFCGNKRNYKHEPIGLLEQNSAAPYGNLKPKIIKIYNKESRIMNYELCTTYLFKYLIKNLHKDKKRLAATAQLYIAAGLYQIIYEGKKELSSETLELSSFFSGGLANNKIISSYLASKGFSANKKIPRGDAGISFGQIIYCSQLRFLFC